MDRKALAACADYDNLLAATAGSIYHEALLHVRSSTAGSCPTTTTTEALLRSTYFSHMYRLIHKSSAGETKSCCCAFSASRWTCSTSSISCA